MKIMAIGDIHGRTKWKKANTEGVDKVIFIGDYVDSFDESNELMVSNLREIIELKKAEPDKYVLILGNHDIQYLYYPDYRCSGFRAEIQIDLTELFRTNRDLFQVAYQVGDYLFTHAGVCKDWYIEFMPFMKDMEGEMADILNTLHHDREAQKVLFKAGYMRSKNYGAGGIVWADKNETIDDMVYGLHQIVGHTRVSMIQTWWNKERDASMTYIDVLEKSTAFYELIVDS